MPILVLTANASTSEKVTHFEAGADDYLTKPFAFEELLVRVKALFRRGTVNSADLLRIGDLEIDAAASKSSALENESNSRRRDAACWNT